MATAFRESLNSGIVKRAQRGFTHLRRGTLLDRLQTEWQDYVKRRRLKWWTSQNKKREYTEKKIQPDLRIRLYFDSILSHHIYYYEEYEQSELQFLRAFLKPGDVFVDIGANIGLYTLIAAQQVGREGHIHAFEPSTKPYQRLLENVGLNHLANVTCHCLALSDTANSHQMTVSLDGYDAWNSLGKPVRGQLFGTEIVNCVSWDNFAKRHDLIGRVSMMKIDVEGWESRVLAGGYKVLSREDSPILQVEFTEETSQAAGSSCREIYHYLEELGYKMFIYDPTSNRLIPDPVRERYPYMNVIAAKRIDHIVARLEENPYPLNRTR